MTWEQANHIASTIQNVLTSIALILGAIWAYYRFIRFRTLKPRLDFSFDVNSFSDGNKGHIAIVGLKISNKGNTRVDLRKDANQRCYLKYGLVTAPKSTEQVSIISQTSKQLKHVDKVFTAHKWIEPGETIDDVKILHMPTQNAIAVQLEMEVFGEQKWSAIRAFPLSNDASIGTFNSEDEQDDYKESEVWVAEIETNIEKIQPTLKLPNLSDDRKNELERLISDAQSLLTDLTKTRPVSKEQVQKLLTEFKKYLE